MHMNTHRAAGGQQARQMAPLGKPRGSDEAADAAPYRAVSLEAPRFRLASMFEHPLKIVRLRLWLL